MNHPAQPLPVAVLISGRGTNLQAIMDEAAAGRLPIVIRLVLSNRGDAYGLIRAREAGIPTAVMEHGSYADRAAYDRALLQRIDASGADFVVLAGFMRILTAEFVRYFDGRIINVHPSLLPDFTGLDTHRRALAKGVQQHGTSVHFVTEQLDGGPVIIRARVDVNPEDDEESLAHKVQHLEHRILPLTIAWYAAGRLRKRGDRVEFDGRMLEEPLDYADVVRCGPGAPLPAMNRPPP